MRGLFRQEPSSSPAAAARIGGAICRSFAGYGCKVGVFDKNLDGANKVAGEITKAGGKGCVSGVDIADYAAVGKAIERFEAEMGPTDVLVNQCGLDRFRELRRHHARALGPAHRINLRGAAQHEPFRPQRHGGARPWPRSSISPRTRVASVPRRKAVYSACKGGIIAFTKTVAREVARKGITLNSVCPGRPTRLCWPPPPARASAAKECAQPGQRHPDEGRRPAGDIRAPVCFLASDDAALITRPTISGIGRC